MENKILVTGGSGMIGCFLKEIIPNAIYISSKDYDLRDINNVNTMMIKYKPKVVIHLAAKVGGIIDNINKPAEYFVDNILMNTNMVTSSYNHKVERFIGILSTCIYPDKVNDYPMSESILHDGAPTPTNFSYGYAKRCLAVQIDAYNKQYKTKYQYLTPCNLYGEYDKWGENSHFVAALIKKIIKAKNNGDKELPLFGTGRPLRQFMYGGDLAKVIKLCIDNNITDSFNVANKENYSIKEISDIALDVIGPGSIESINFDVNKPDGQYRKDVSINKLLKLIPNFEATSLRDGILKTYKNLPPNLD